MTYDCFTFFNELDLLEIRLNILDPYVDYFVIGESKQTFSGKEKPLYFLESEDRFKKWANKIIRVEIEPADFSNAFERAAYQKDSLRYILMSRPANNSDIVYFGDLDEIWKPQKITDDKVYNLQQLNYCYYLDNRSSENWVGTIVGQWKTLKTNTFNHWRATHTNELPNGGWHFTNCMGYDNIIKKLEAYDHTEFDTEDVKSNLKDRIEHGEDYVGRKFDWLGIPFEFWEDESDLPEFLRKNKHAYQHLFK
jgi:beta-1,4-mannosyl-glycoprotein beta-1,4-N-acetylglucosaminyltransferase